jgi:hypothetical protein
MSRRFSVSLIALVFAGTSFSCLAADRILMDRLAPTGTILPIANCAMDGAPTFGAE